MTFEPPSSRESGKMVLLSVVNRIPLVGICLFLSRVSVICSSLHHSCERRFGSLTMHVLIFVLVFSSRDRDQTTLKEEEGISSHFSLFSLCFVTNLVFIFTSTHLLTNLGLIPLSWSSHITNLSAYVLPTLVVSEALVFEVRIRECWF
jgi:hypothetical protein